jgi:RND family efflux transporter MFP subunit
MKRTLPILLVLVAVAALAWGIARRFAELATDAAGEAQQAPVPVAVAPVERGAITLRRTFSGALEATAEFVVAPKVSGRVERLAIDLGDTVERGQVVAHLDDDELVQDVHQAEADVAVARAHTSAARSALEIAGRELVRAQALRSDGVASESQLDARRAEELAARAGLEVAEANVTRAEAALEAARIRLGYARVAADWSGGDDRRVVSERHVDEGGTVSANGEILTIVELDPIVAVVHAPERDYARLAIGQVANLVTDAHPGRRFEARIARIAPVFRRATRQARIELLVDNADELLKPGMFVRATIELERLTDATLVPFEALTERGDTVGVFVLDADGEHVRWRPVEAGVREGERVQVRGEDVAGRVVVLGQELCDDGARVTVPGADTDAGRSAAQ